MAVAFLLAITKFYMANPRFLYLSAACFGLVAVRASLADCKSRRSGGPARNGYANVMAAFTLVLMVIASTNNGQYDARQDELRYNYLSGPTILSA